MKKEVLIVEPASSSANVFSFFSYLPLMGPLYMGTILKQNGFNVSVLNENTLKSGLLPQDLDADFLLLSCLTPTVKRGYELAGAFKKVRPDGKVIIGGPHVTFVKEEAAEYADHVVLGEGENIITDLIKYGSDEKFIQGTQVEDLNNLPAIDWEILRGGEKGRIMPIMTSRGCPFACNFCSVTEMFGRRYRAMSAERVIEELSTNKKPYAFFYDDNFTADLKRSHQIMDRLISHRSRPRRWMAQVRADVAKDPELVEKMARSGCERVYIGFESINPKTLKTLKKSQTPEDISRAIQILHKNGIKVHGMFMYGSDSDDPEVVKETVKFVKRSRVDSVQYMILTPMPGTEMFRKIESEERLIHRSWEYYDGLHVVFWPEQFSPIGLQQLAIESFKSFYSLAGAANEIINLFADEAIRSLGWIADRGRIHTYSFKNALFKAGGRFILNKWDRINRSYITYLRQISGDRRGGRSYNLWPPRRAAL